MIFRNSINSILRSKGKTALFTLVIFALTLALILSVSVWAAVAQFLDDCDDFYTTIGLVEYMGADYPDDDIYDPAMADAIKSLDTSMIKEDDGVLLWEEPSRTFGYVDGFWRTDNFMPNKMLSVLVVGNVSEYEDSQLYSATVYKSLYSATIKENKYIYIDKDFGDFEKGHFYLVFGEVYRGYSPILHLRTAAFDNALAAADELTVPRMIDITADEESSKFYTIPEDCVLTQIADTLAVTNNSILVSGTDNLMALPPFHQEELYFVDGRTFTQEEYTSGKPVAVISDLMAARLGIGIGDSIDLSLAVSDQPGFYNSYWAGDGFSHHEKFTVVGITNTIMDKSWYVYVPKASAIPTSQFQIGYIIGHAVLKNDKAGDFLARMEPHFNGRFQLRIYDQGYSAVAIPYQRILRTAIIVTAVCALVELAVIILFGFLFVYRQRETSKTMLMLGAGKPRILIYFLISAGLIAFVSTISGAAGGYWLHDKIIALVAKTAEQFTLIDHRYSNGNLTISKTLEFAPQLELQFFFSLSAVIFLLVVLTCLAFTVSTFKNKNGANRKRRGPKSAHKTTKLPGGLMKYTLLSISRCGARSLIVPLLAAVVILFFGHLSRTASQYQRQLEAVYDNTTIHGYYTDINGEQIGNLVLNAYDVANLFTTGKVGELNASIERPYYFNGISQLSDGTKTGISPLYVPDNSFRRESTIATIQRGSHLAATNDIRTSPQFYYADTVTMNFLEGFDESILTVPGDDPDALSCIIPTDLMAEEKIVLGDTIRVSMNIMTRDPDNGERIFVYIDLHVVGSYEKQGSENTIYIPLSLFFETSLIWGEGQPATGEPADAYDLSNPFTAEQIEELQARTFHSANFKLKDSHDLHQVKNYLSEYGYSQVHNVGKVREFIILRDASFNNAGASIKQQTHYINILYPFLYALVGIISITVSYLLIVSRKYEFATMRGLGATTTRTFFNFFSEQFILCSLGTTLGAVLWYLLWETPTPTHIILSGGFLACYFIGSAVSIIIMNRSHVLTFLLERE